MRFKTFDEFINEGVSINIIVGLNDDRFKESCHICATELSEELKSVPYDFIYNDLLENSDPKISIIAVDDTNTILGAICCRINSIQNIIDENHGAKVESFNNDDSIIATETLEGFALAVRKEYRNTQVVSKLLRKMDSLDYPFIIIQQFEGLKSNINYATKGCKKVYKISPPEWNASIIMYVKMNTK